MKNYLNFIIIFTSLSTFSCGPTDNSCGKDTDCAAGRICEYGVCTYPKSNPPPTTLKACGQIDTSCNCATTSAVPGLITNSILCESGKHIFFQCAGYCQGGFPWGTECYCPP